MSVLVSQPSVGLLLQSRNTPLHTPTPQLPPLQTAVPLLTTQARLQAPQWATLESVLDSQPSTTELLQSSQGETQLAISQRRLLQTGAPFWTEHWVEQLPQVLISLTRLASQPSE